MNVEADWRANVCQIITSAIQMSTLRRAGCMMNWLIMGTGHSRGRLPAESRASRQPRREKPARAVGRKPQRREPSVTPRPAPVDNCGAAADNLMASPCVSWHALLLHQKTVLRSPLPCRSAASAIGYGTFATSHRFGISVFRDRDGSL
ncbi:hypothetical protein ANO11243_003010 [Dothideomycetidae sp. 11243]|nr:hypothetical protein ANO11243_003010 [fungal sp. No.11243]